MDNTHLRPPDSGTFLKVLTNKVESNIGSFRSYSFVEVHIYGYNITDVITQLIEDIGEDELLRRIESLR